MSPSCSGRFRDSIAQSHQRVIHLLPYIWRMENQLLSIDRLSCAEALAAERPQELMLLPRVTQLKTCAGIAVSAAARGRAAARGYCCWRQQLCPTRPLRLLGGLVSISVDRAQALENAARSRGRKEKSDFAV